MRKDVSLEVFVQVRISWVITPTETPMYEYQLCRAYIGISHKGPTLGSGLFRTIP